jgi:hypothetical protein
MTQNEANGLSQLVSSDGPYPPFELPSSILNGMATVDTVVETDGNIVPATVSTTGQLGSSILSPSSPDFLNLIQYFSQSPGIANSPSNNSCPSYTTSQYKCMPFNKFRDLSGNLADPNNPYVTLQDRIAGGSSLQGTVSMSAGDIWPIILDVVLGVLALVFIVFFISMFFGQSERTAVAVSDALIAARAATATASATVPSG